MGVGGFALRLGLPLALGGLLLGPGGSGRCGTLCLFLDGGHNQFAGNRQIGLALYPTVVVHRLLQGHFVDKRGNILLFGKFAPTAAAVSGHKLVFAILPQTEDDWLLYAAGLDAAHQTAVALVRLLGDKYAGQVVDF